MKAIEVKHLTKDFGSGRGIFDVNFDIAQGEVFGFLGPNGAGKTTTIRHLMGFTQPGDGHTKILGLDSSKKYHEIMKNIGYLPGEITLPEGLTGWQFIRMMQKMRHSKNETYLNYLLDKFELDPTGSMKRMSLGNKRKLAIVTAFMDDPAILILDEPTSGLDPIMQEKFIQFMIEEKNRNKTILLSSHIFPEVEATCDRIAIIKEGRIVSEVNASTLKNETDKHYILSLSSKEECKKFIQGLDVESVSASLRDQDVEIRFDHYYIPQVLRYVSKFKVTKLKEVKFDLESYFLEFYNSDRIFAEV